MDFVKDECCICLEKNMAQTFRPGELNCIQLTCCGCCFCRTCLDQFNKQEEETGVPWNCPLCRAPKARSFKENFTRTMKKAMEGKGWVQEWIGMEYYKGCDLPQSFSKALEFLSLAAAQGRANAQFSLGNMYREGKGVKQSYEKAFELFKQSADNGLPDAFGAVGYCYKYGQGVGKSPEKAFEVFILGSELGDDESQSEVAECYLERG